MESKIIVIIAAVSVLAPLLLVGRRLLRFAIRMVLVVFILIAMLGAFTFAWWNGWFDKHPAGQTPSRPVPTRRVSSH